MQQPHFLKTKCAKGSYYYNPGNPATTAAPPSFEFRGVRGRMPRQQFVEHLIYHQSRRQLYEDTLDNEPNYTDTMTVCITQC